MIQWTIMTKKIKTGILDIFFDYKKKNVYIKKNM